MENDNVFRNLPVGTLIFRVSFPVILSMIIQAFYNIVDSLFVSRLGLQALTALGLAYPVQILMIAVSNGIGVGMNTSVSQRFGKREYREAGQAIGNAISIAIIFSMCMIIFGIFFCRSFFEFCSSDPVVIHAGYEYLFICCILNAGLFFSIIGQRLCIAIGKSFIGMLAHLCGAVFNLIFDPILIFGLFHFPAMGVKGAAIATILGQWLTAVIVFGYYYRKTDETMHFKAVDLIPGKMIFEILKTGIPAAVTIAIGSVMSFGMNQILKEEATGLAIFTVFYKLWCFVSMPITGLLQGVTPIIGYSYGARLKERLRSAMRITMLTGIFMMLAVTMVFLLFAPEMISMFDSTDSEFFQQAGVYAIRVISMIFVPFAIGQIGSNIFQGMGEGLPSLVYSLLHQCIFLLPAAVFLLHTFGLSAVWYSFWIAEGLSVVIVCIMYYIFYRKKVCTL